MVIKLSDYLTNEDDVQKFIRSLQVEFAEAGRKNNELRKLVYHNDYSTPGHQNSGVKKDG